MSEIHGATGSYVLNALDPSELDEFEAHLAVCPTCSREVVEFCETAAELSLLSQATPPPALKGSIMSAIGGVRVLPPLPEPDVAAESQLQVGPAPVDELALRRQRRATRLLSLAVAAAMVVALALGGWVVNLVQQRDAQIASVTAETQLLSAPDVEGYTVALKNGGRATFIVSKSMNAALLSGTELPPLAADQTYQAWTLQGTQATRDALVSSGESVKQWMSGPVRSSTAVAISIEPQGGSDVPTKANILAIQAI